MGKLNWRSSMGLCIVLTCCGIASAGNVEIVVNPTLYASGEITAGLNQYIADVQAQGYTPILTTSAFADAAALRSHLANRYNTVGLEGTVFVGDLPTATYQQELDAFPCDLYYMDLDGTWTASGGGYLDTHEAGTGDEMPEIFLGRLTASTAVNLYPGASEASLLNQYFAKNHAYRTGQLSVAPNGLVYVEEDWSDYRANQWASDMAPTLSGTVTLVDEPNVTADHDYEAHLATGEYENLWIGAHSDVGYHRFEQPFEGDWNAPDDWCWTTSPEVAAMNPKVLFYNLWACYSSKYTANGYLGGAYLFGNDYGLIACGSTKSGGMLLTSSYFGALAEGKTFGEAFYDWWQAEALRYGYPDGYYTEYLESWDYGQTLMGDPLLVTQSYIPEPVTLTLLTAGLACLAGRRRRA